jgi:hypothetical protein
VNKKIFAASLMASLAVSVCAADFNLGISGSDSGIKGFSLSVGDYYQAPVEEIRVVRRGLPEEELSVVYYLARKAHKNPEYIAKMRTNGRSWWDITLALGLDPRVVYVVDEHKGNAYGHYKHNKNQRLKDVEVVEVVNTRFLADYHHVSQDEIYQKRQGGRNYDAIDDDYRGKKDKGHKSKNRDDDEHPGKSHGKGHGNDRD